MGDIFSAKVGAIIFGDDNTFYTPFIESFHWYNFCFSINSIFIHILIYKTLIIIVFTDYKGFDIMSNNIGIDFGDKTTTFAKINDVNDSVIDKHTIPSILSFDEKTKSFYFGDNQTYEIICNKNLKTIFFDGIIENSHITRKQVIGSNDMDATDSSFQSLSNKVYDEDITNNKRKTIYYDDYHRDNNIFDQEVTISGKNTILSKYWNL